MKNIYMYILVGKKKVESEKERAEKSEVEKKVRRWERTRKREVVYYETLGSGKGVCSQYLRDLSKRGERISQRLGFDLWT